ncbi:LysR substrate-binding domain-containing protein [Halomonas maura]|nr:LysR substrate-binding domain-containing protein [Halomonas maura]
MARELEIGQSTISRHLRELEEAVGVPLLSRTTRRVTLTEEGARYYASSMQILRLVEQANDEARGTRGAAAGTIRISCTAAFGVLHLSRLIFDFQDQYPDIGIDLNFTDERVDLVREGVDIALRLGPLTDSSMKLRAVGECTRLLVAAPEYLAMRQTPTAPRDLAQHEGIRMSNVAGSDTLDLEDPSGQRYAVSLGGRFRVDHGLAAREAFVAGRGIGPAHLWLVEDLLATGQLKTILPNYSLPTVPLNMLIVPERANIARVRLLVDFLVEQIGRIRGVERPHSRHRVPGGLRRQE